MAKPLGFTGPVRFDGLALPVGCVSPSKGFRRYSGTKTLLPAELGYQPNPLSTLVVESVESVDLRALKYSPETDCFWIAKGNWSDGSSVEDSRRDSLCSHHVWFRISRGLSLLSNPFNCFTHATDEQKKAAEDRAKQFREWNRVAAGLRRIHGEGMARNYTSAEFSNLTRSAKRRLQNLVNIRARELMRRDQSLDILNATRIAEVFLARNLRKQLKAGYNIDNVLFLLERRPHRTGTMIPVEHKRYRKLDKDDQARTPAIRRLISL